MSSEKQMLSQTEEEMRQELQRLMKLFECPICLSLLSAPMTTRCLHRFCGQCILKAIESSSNEFCRCPLCKEKITKRGLRKQDDIGDMVEALKEAVDSFEKDNKMSIITEHENVVIFDVSTDVSKSCLEFDQSGDQTIDELKNEIKSGDKTEEPIAESADNESNQKTTTITCASNTPSGRQSVLSIDEDISEDINVTDIYFNTTKSYESMNDKPNDSLVVSEINDSTISSAETIPTQSQNLKVIKSKSKITYSSSSLRPSRTDEMFDRIIGIVSSDDNKCDKINEKSDENPKPNESITESEVKSVNNEKIIPRKPLNHLNKNIDGNKKYKRIQIIDSSDDESTPVSVNNGNKVYKMSDSRENESNKEVNQEIRISDDDMDDDLFLPDLHSNESLEINRTNDWHKSESKGYESDTQLIGSSPFTSDIL